MLIKPKGIWHINLLSLVEWFWESISTLDLVVIDCKIFS